ncbi:MAG: ATP-binding cassette domain-containing protein [Candidatus Limnocylindrales bacterium]|jgi:ABC-2 type transport system ATP-binding protein
MSVTPAILVESLEKSYGSTRALDGLDLAVEEGTILGVLGPNGAGKTTVVRILATLLAPDAGRALVAGLDVVKQARAVRNVIGLTGQFAAVDENLSGFENLKLFGQLYHLSGAVAERRADELLDGFGLADAARRLVRTYSGGMRRRLDLAASVITSPPILFLDEPTSGLDPRGRLAVWEVIRNLVAAGTTVFLTTQDMEEADQLADRIAVVDLGRAIATGTGDELKLRIGGERLELTLAGGGDVAAAVAALRPHCSGEIQVDGERLHLVAPLAHGAGELTAIVRDLDAAHLSLADLALRRPTLDDVFLSLTGRHATGADQTAETVSGGSRR